MESSIIYSVRFTVIDDNFIYLIQLSAVPPCQTFSITCLILLKLTNLGKLIGVKCFFSSTICLERGCPGNTSAGRDLINSLWFGQSHSSTTSLYGLIFLSPEYECQPTTNGTGPRRVLGSATTLDRRHQHEIWWALPAESQQLAASWEEGDFWCPTVRKIQRFLWVVSIVEL